ncbi:hypothetical protein FRC12_002552, partial [Ceratobasidium sp. 428]
SVAYSPDGAYITSGSDDETVRIWDTHLVIPTGLAQDPQDDSHRACYSRVAPGVNSLQQRMLCNLGCLIECVHMAWTLNEDGWIVYNDHKLIWVPADLRFTLVHPYNTAVIHRRGFLQLDLDCNKLGDRWYEHFRPGRSLKP